MADIRRVPLGRYRYTVFCRIGTAELTVEIVRVVHGARVKSLGQLPDDDA